MSGMSFNRNFIQSLFLLLSILLLVISSYIYLLSIDRKVVFFFFNLLLFAVIRQSIMEDEEEATKKIHAAFDRGNEKKSHVAVSVELVELENEEEGKMRGKIDEKESHVAVSFGLVEVENEEEEGKRRVEIDIKERQAKDELREKIEAFIEKVKSQRRMEELQLVNVRREMTKS